MYWWKPSNFPKGDSGPNAQRVSRASRPPRWWGERRTSSITCTASLVSCAKGSWPQVTSTTWWRTAGWCVRPTTRPPNREVSCISMLYMVRLCADLFLSSCCELCVWRDNEVTHKLWPTCANCVVARNPIDSKLRKVEEGLLLLEASTGTLIIVCVWVWVWAYLIMFNYIIGARTVQL